jgi:hypothetical protein
LIVTRSTSSHKKVQTILFQVLKLMNRSYLLLMQFLCLHLQVSLDYILMLKSNISLILPKNFGLIHLKCKHLMHPVEVASIKKNILIKLLLNYNLNYLSCLITITLERTLSIQLQHKLYCYKN